MLGGFGLASKVVASDQKPSLQHLKGARATMPNNRTASRIGS
jgi:hypothetical protein